MNYYVIQFLDKDYVTVTSELSHKKFVQKLLKSKLFKVDKRIYVNNGIRSVYKRDNSMETDNLRLTEGLIKFGAEIE